MERLFPTAGRIKGPPPKTSPPSKTALVMIGSSPLALLGLDRMYMECYRSGWAKFLLFVIVVVLGPLLGPLFIPLLVLYVAWALLDFLRIVLNAFSFSELRPFCDRSMTNIGWTSARDIRWAFWINLAINLVYVAFAVLALAVLVTRGPDAVWDELRSYTNTTTQIPDSERMRGYAEKLLASR